ncbi:hypothetical protein BIV57_11520 [Mangrovactinospora gilvigrisea]|uniref:DUF2304 domain-containing protein n=1 Tax=Mangrovactinospora gilvigrisea TaxID=1428644 RepID=A0A1J7BFA4_9ACTN|nr:hypothetical protein [Mangrovactinospora gilvigrisea]OIV37363.1 hypothetical protein BIV57_11520 [Mangrovactinospora gilvigrisea]
MTLSISLVLLLLVLVVVMLRKAGLKPVHALICALFGFYLASTGLAPTIRDFTSNLANMLGSFKF